MEKTTKKLIAEEKDMRIPLSEHCSDRTRECCLNCTYRDKCSIVKTLRTNPDILFDDSIYDLRLKCDDFKISDELLDDTSAIKSFIERTEKIFHNKADVYLEGEYSDDPKVLIHLYKDCYQYWNDFVKKCLPIFTFDDIYPTFHGNEFKYEDDGYFLRDGIKSFGTVIYFDELFDIEVDFDFAGDTKNFTISKIIDFYNDQYSDIRDLFDAISSSVGSQISKIFGDISDKEVEYLLYRMIANK